MAPRYSVRGSWNVQAPPATVFDAVADVERYPLWWPTFVDAVPTGDGGARTTIEGLFKVQFEFLIRPELLVPAEGRVQLSLDGDVTGFTRFDLVPVETGGHAPDGVVATPATTRWEYLQEFDVVHPRLQRYARLMPGILLLSQRYAMHRAVRGLARYLATDEARGLPAPSPLRP